MSGTTSERDPVASTYRELVEFAKREHARFHALRGRRMTSARGCTVRNRASKDMLTKLFDLMRDNALERASVGELCVLGAKLAKRDLRVCSLHFHSQFNGLDGMGGLVVHAEAARERFAELDLAEGGGQNKQLGCSGQVTECLRVAKQRALTLQGEYRCRGPRRERGRRRVEWFPCARERRSLGFGRVLRAHIIVKRPSTDALRHASL